MRSFLKGAASYLGSALWWITDKLWGDQIFNWARPMIPDWLTHPAREDIARWAIAYGPPLALFVLGTFFFLRNRKEEVPKNTILISLERFRRRIRVWIERVEPSHVIILGLAIALGGVIWQMRRAPSPESKTTHVAVNAADTPLIWNWKDANFSFVSVAGKAEPNLSAFTLRGENAGPGDVAIQDAYISSGVIGGKKIPLRILSDAGWINIKDADPIPKTEIILSATFGENGITEGQYWKDWGTITVTLVYNEKVVRRTLDEKWAKIPFDNVRSKPQPPRVTKRSESASTRYNPEPRELTDDQINAMAGFLLPRSKHTIRIYFAPTDEANSYAGQIHQGFKGGDWDIPARGIEPLKMRPDLPDHEGVSIYAASPDGTTPPLKAYDLASEAMAKAGVPLRGSGNTSSQNNAEHVIVVVGRKPTR